MGDESHQGLSRRERQIMDVVYKAGRATAAEVREAMSDPPSYSAVRATMRVLEDKGHLRHIQDGPRYLYVPTLPKESAQESALQHLLRTFFDGKAESAVAALLDLKAGEMASEELDRLAALVEQARREGR